MNDKIFDFWFFDFFNFTFIYTGPAFRTCLIEQLVIKYFAKVKKKHSKNYFQETFTYEARVTICQCSSYLYYKLVSFDIDCHQNEAFPNWTGFRNSHISE